LGVGLLGANFGRFARIPLAGGRRIGGTTLTRGLIGLLAAPVDR